MTLPSPDWSVQISFGASELNRASPLLTGDFPSKYVYSDDDIDRAKTFIKDVLRPFISTKNSIVPLA